MYSEQIIILVKSIIFDIEKELNTLNKTTKKKIKNQLYKLGNINLQTTTNEEKYYAFIIKKSFFNKITFELRSTQPVIASNVNLNDYKMYKNTEDISIFNDEALVKIKYFLLSFAELEG